MVKVVGGNISKVTAKVTELALECMCKLVFLRNLYDNKSISENRIFLIHTEEILTNKEHKLPSNIKKKN